MKSFMRVSLVWLAVGLLSVVACQKTEETSDTTPADASSASAPQTAEQSIDYAWAGAGDNSTMGLTVTNRSEREWEVEIEVGTKLEPGKDNVQAMVVTKEVKVEIHPHDVQHLEVQVACLDISKDPPATTDVSWNVQVSPQLAAFIACAKRLAPSDDASYGPFFVQYSLWQARGATKQQWVDFFTHYPPPLSQADAEVQAEHFAQEFGEVVQQCPSI